MQCDLNKKTMQKFKQTYILKRNTDLPLKTWQHWPAQQLIHTEINLLTIWDKRLLTVLQIHSLRESAIFLQTKNRRKRKNVSHEKRILKQN